ncbi:hypothetical protein ALC57_07759 [Trachymyrmex cornetzi]|uniref:Uncharacterized protein n=1 Tax=Trachymyrmex cornetzi TaxID=471704 RepID=A0A195E4A7_9HYME|nr:hypothetical protein ALC57_07759 [Trachymyrmex cornetzi]
MPVVCAPVIKFTVAPGPSTGQSSLQNSNLITPAFELVNEDVTRGITSSILSLAFPRERLAYLSAFLLPLSSCHAVSCILLVRKLPLGRMGGGVLIGLRGDTH